MKPKEVDVVVSRIARVTATPSQPTSDQDGSSLSSRKPISLFKDVNDRADKKAIRVYGK